MIKRTVLVVVAGFCATAHSGPTLTIDVVTQTSAALAPQANSFADVILNQANETCGANNVQDFLTAARDTKEYVAKHPYFAGSIVAIAAGPQRISRVITLPFRFVARTASTMLVVAATTLAVMHREAIATWVKEQTANAKSTLATFKESTSLAAIRFTPSVATPVGLPKLD